MDSWYHLYKSTCRGKMYDLTKIKTRCEGLKVYGPLSVQQPNWVHFVDVFFIPLTSKFCKVSAKVAISCSQNAETRKEKCYAKMFKGQIKGHKSSSDKCVAIYLAISKCLKETFSWPRCFVLISHIASAFTPHSFCLSSTPLSLTRQSPSPVLEPYLIGAPPLFA